MRHPTFGDVVDSTNMEYVMDYDDDYPMTHDEYYRWSDDELTWAELNGDVSVQE